MRFHKKFRVALVTLLILGLVTFPSTAKAAETSASFPEPTYTGSVNGVERSLIFSKNEAGEIITYFKVGDEDPVRYGRDIDTGFDRYGAIWFVDKELGGCIGWWSYELAGGDTSKISSFTLLVDPENPMDFLQGIESLVYEGTGTGAVVTGYKDSSGETHSLLSFEEMREIDGFGSTVPEPSYVPSVPVETPTPSPTVTPQESVSILDTYIGYVDGVEGVDGINGVDRIEQTLLVTKDDSGKIIPYFTIEGWDFYESLGAYHAPIKNAAVDKYGSIELLREDGQVLWWNYYVTPDISVKIYTFLPNPVDPTGYMNSIESFIFDGSGSQAVISGYRSTTGEIYPVPSFEEMKEQSDFYKSKVTPHYIPKGVTPKPSASPTEMPTQKPATATPTATPISKPSETPSLATATPTATPISKPSETPSLVPATPTATPILEPSETPSLASATPTATPISKPSETPSLATATPTATPISKPSETPSLATATPTATPTSVPTKVPATATPSLEPTATSAPVITGTDPVVTPQTKLSIKKSKKKGVTIYSLREGDKVAMEYSLKKGKLAWKAGKRKGTMKNVKYLAFIRKSRNLYVGDRKGRGYIISSKSGKKRLVIKKGAKAPILSGGFGIKVKKASGRPLNITNL